METQSAAHSRLGPFLIQAGHARSTVGHIETDGTFAWRGSQAPKTHSMIRRKSGRVLSGGVLTAPMGLRIDLLELDGEDARCSMPRRAFAGRLRLTELCSSRHTAAPSRILLDELDVILCMTAGTGVSKLSESYLDSGSW